VNQALTLPSIGDVVDEKFRIERKLGEGGTSTIYAVRHVITDKQFVIKWLSPELAQNALAVQRFVHEAKLCGQFKHPNAVEIYDIARSSDSYYLLMELLEGETLETRLERVGRMSAQAACDILLPCIEALGVAHRVGIVHRDLKPSNIFLCQIEGRSDEVPKVLDFGISKLSQNGQDLSPITTTTRTVIGTPYYMAPEQLRGYPADPRFDIYALGVVLYELLAGKPPFECEVFAELVFKIIEGRPPRLDQQVDVDPQFAEIVARAMALNAEDRFATMEELAEALRPYASQPVWQAEAQPFVSEAAPDASGTPPVAMDETAPAVLEEGTPIAVEVPAPAATQPSAANEAHGDSGEVLFPSHSRGLSARWLGLLGAVGVALIVVWQTSARETRVTPATTHRWPPIAPAVVKPAVQPAPQPTAAEPLEWNTRGPEPVLQPHPTQSAAADPADPAKPARKNPRMGASSKASAGPVKRRLAAPEISVSPEKRADSDGAPPEADLSRKDF
jgi:serine/threonine protein kinase